MNTRRVVLTGTTGFIGSHLAEELLAQGYEVIALRRNHSNFKKVAGIKSQLTWINTDEGDWEQQLVLSRPSYVVHSAWSGVEAGHREDWPSQLNNLVFTFKLLNSLAQGALVKVIVLGSQAEYGAFEGRIDESSPCNPINAYGAVKLATQALVRAFCESCSIEWYWLRVFAVFGPREDPHWFVSFVAAGLLKQESPDLTGCAQQYDYLFVKDLARAIVQTLPAAPGLSGVYNVGGNHATSLRAIVDAIQRIIGSSKTINYGAVPYRQGQVMHMEGNSDRFEKAFGPITQTALLTALEASVAFVKQNIEI